MTPLHCAAAPELEGQSGGYFIKCTRADSSALSRDPNAAARLWAWSARRCGLAEE